MCSFLRKQACCSSRIMISLIIYCTAYCFLSPVSCCMTFIPASPLRHSKNRRWTPWLKSSAANSSRGKVCHFFFPVTALGTELLTNTGLNGCVKNQSQMFTLPNKCQLILRGILQSISCFSLKGWDHIKRSIIQWVIPAQHQDWAAVPTVLYDQ